MIPLYKPFMPELPQLNDVLYSGALAYGAQTKAFESDLKTYFGDQKVLVTNTFNSAISVVLTALGAQPGDEVIASPMACLASTQPYHAAGMKIVWADVDPSTGTLLPEDVAKKITPKVKCIIHNHFCGYPGHIDEINAVGAEYGLPVIDDGIECFGSIYKGKKIGSNSNIAVFSFNPVRLPNTIDGAAIVLRDESLYKKCILIRDCGIDRSCFRDDRGEISPDCDITLTGYSATMSNVNGYIGCEQMRYVDELLVNQRENMAMWDAVLRPYGNYTPVNNPNRQANGWVYGILADNKDDAIRFFREKGFFASGVHINNDRYSVFGRSMTLPGVADFYSRFVAVPSGWWVQASDVQAAFSTKRN